MNYAVIMAGGRGERFWPLSRQARPKQFLKLISNKTMLEETIDRVAPLIPRDYVRVVTTGEMSKLILSEIPGVGATHILAEPVGRNTCLAIGLAATHLLHENERAVMVVLSADHIIRPEEKLNEILRDGCAMAAMEDVLITIGIVPTRPDTGYGYIRFGEVYKREGESTTYEVKAFAEKPKAVVAQEYYFSKSYFWNSGMFIWSAKSFLKALRKCLPEMAEQLDEYATAIGTKKEEKAREKLYETAASISVDYAVLEKADNVLVIKGDFIWDDVGSWNALERYKERDKDNNVLIGNNVILDTYETTICNDSNGLIACVGVSDLVVVRANDITLVVHKTKATEVKKLLAKVMGSDEFKKYL